MKTQNRSLKNIVCDEIALEGLDGITFQALWLRIQEATSHQSPLDDVYKGSLWDAIKYSKTLGFHLLETAREDLILYNRFTSDDDVPKDIYPHFPVDDVRRGVRGSCSTYNTREQVTKLARTMSYAQIMKEWGSRFVIVANQQQREQALLGRKGRLNNFTIVRYCLLERIGRSRYHGEITYGSNSLLALGEDPKTLFYHRKALLRVNLITKQVYHKKTKKHSHTGTLLHLRRFHVEQKSKYMKLTEVVVSYLKTKENYRALYDDVKNLGNPNCIRKLFKTSEFQHFVTTEIKLPYREFYPDAPVKDWKLKGSDKEKHLRVMQLVDPNMSVRENWPAKEEVEDLTVSTILDYSRLCFGRTYLNQACEAIRLCGGDGCSQSELGIYLGAPRLTARSMTRNLLRTNMIAAFMNDVGRQRVTRFCYREYEVTGSMAKKFNAERQRTINLLLSSSEAEVASSVSDVARTDVNVKDESDEPARKKKKLTDEEECDELEFKAIESCYSDVLVDEIQESTPDASSQSTVECQDIIHSPEVNYINLNAQTKIEICSLEIQDASIDKFTNNVVNQCENEILILNPCQGQSPTVVQYSVMGLDGTGDSSSSDDEHPAKVPNLDKFVESTSLSLDQKASSISSQVMSVNQPKVVDASDIPSTSSGITQEGNNVKPYKGKNIPNKNLSKSSVRKKRVHFSNELVSKLKNKLGRAFSRRNVPSVRSLAYVSPCNRNSSFDMSYRRKRNLKQPKSVPKKKPLITASQVRITPQIQFAEQHVIQEVCQMEEFVPMYEAAHFVVHTATENYIQMNECVNEFGFNEEIILNNRETCNQMNTSISEPNLISAPLQDGISAVLVPDTGNVSASTSDFIKPTLQQAFSSVNLCQSMPTIQQPRNFLTAERQSGPTVGFARRIINPPIQNIFDEHEYYPPVLNGRKLNGHITTIMNTHHNYSSTESEPDESPLYFEVKAQIEHHDNPEQEVPQEQNIARQNDISQYSSQESDSSEDIESPNQVPNQGVTVEENLDVHIDELTLNASKICSADQQSSILLSDSASSSSIIPTAGDNSVISLPSKKGKLPKGMLAKSSRTKSAEQKQTHQQQHQHLMINQYEHLITEMINNILHEVRQETNPFYWKDIQITTVKNELVKKFQALGMTESESIELVSNIQISLEPSQEQLMHPESLNELAQLKEEVIKIITGMTQVMGSNKVTYTESHRDNCIANQTNSKLLTDQHNDDPSSSTKHCNRKGQSKEKKHILFFGQASTENKQSNNEESVENVHDVPVYLQAHDSNMYETIRENITVFSSDDDIGTIEDSKKRKKREVRNVKRICLKNESEMSMEDISRVEQADWTDENV